MATRQDDFVLMKHPKTTAPPVPIRKKVFESYWSKKGWEIHEPVEIDEDAQPLSSLKREELDALAVERGLNPSDFHTKADLVSALES